MDDVGGLVCVCGLPASHRAGRSSVGNIGGGTSYLLSPIKVRVPVYLPTHRDFQGCRCDTRSYLGGNYVYTLATPSFKRDRTTNRGVT